MDIFDFCLEVIEREGKRFNLSLEKFNSSSEDPITAATANDINYDIALNRCAYIYRCGTITISFAKECFTKFITEYEDLIPLMCKWNNTTDLTLCSFTNGAVFDYIALLLSFHNYLPKTSLTLFKKVNLVSKFGAWRNTANIVQQVLTERDLQPFSGLSIGNVEVIQGDPFQKMSDKVKCPISKSDVITMIKCIKFQQDDSNHQEKVLNALMDLFGALKPDAILFCIDTKPVTTLIMDALSKYPGKFLFEPIHVNSNLCLDCPDLCKDRFGCCPIISARGMFFVWQKSSEPITPILEHLTPKLHKNGIKDSSSMFIAADTTYSSILSSDSYSTKKSLSNGTNPASMSSSSSKNCNDSNLYKFSSTSTFIDSNCNVPHAVESTDYNAQSLASSTLLKNKVSTYDHDKQKHQTVSKQKKKSNSVLSSTSVQTDENNFAETDSAKVLALTNRVIHLTKSIGELLQASKSQSACEKKTIKCCKEDSEHHVTHDCISNQCSCMHKYSCNAPVSPNMCVCYAEECMVNCRHICQQTCVSHTQCRCKVLHNNTYQSSRYCTSCNESNFSGNGGDSLATPNLVIPLNSLPKDIISQIISSLSKSD